MLEAETPVLITPRSVTSVEMATREEVLGSWLGKPSATRQDRYAALAHAVGKRHFFRRKVSKRGEREKARTGGRGDPEGGMCS